MRLLAHSANDFSQSSVLWWRSCMWLSKQFAVFRIWGETLDCNHRFVWHQHYWNVFYIRGWVLPPISNNFTIELIKFQVKQCRGSENARMLLSYWNKWVDLLLIGIPHGWQKACAFYYFASAVACWLNSTSSYFSTDSQMETSRSKPNFTGVTRLVVWLELMWVGESFPLPPNGSCLRI